MSWYTAAPPTPGFFTLGEKGKQNNIVEVLDCYPTCARLRVQIGNALDLILFSQNELVDNVKVHKLLGSSDHNQIHFNITEKTGNTYKKNNRRGTSTMTNIKR